MARTVGELAAKLTLDDREFRRGVDDSEGRFRRWGGSVGGLAARAGVGIAAAGAVGFGAMTAQLTGFDTSMREVFTLLPGLSTDARNQLIEDTRAYAREVGRTSDEVLPALYQALSAGVPPDSVFDFMRDANAAAVGGITELETAVDGISSVVNAYGTDVISSAEASDLMFTAVRKGKTTFEELSTSLFQVTPTAAALGVKFGDVTGALAALTAQGVPTRVASTQLRQLLVELSKDGSDASDTFREMAGQSFQEFVAAGGNVQDALGMMEDAADANGVALQDLFGSVEAGQAALALTANEGAAFTDALAAMDDSAGSTQAAYEEMDAGLGRSMAKIKAAAIDAALGFAQEFQPQIEAVVAWVTENLPTIAAVAGQVFRTVGRVIGVVVRVLGRLADFVAQVVEWWQQNMTDLGESTAETGEWLRETWDQITEIVEKAMELVRVIIETVVAGIQAFWSEHGEMLMATAVRIWDAIRDTISGVLDVISGILDVFIGLFTGDWSRMWEGVKSIFSGVAEAIIGIMRTLGETIGAMFTVIADGVTSAWSGLWGGLTGVVSSAWAGIRAVINTIIGGINKLIEGWNRVEFRVPTISLPSFEIFGRRYGGGSIGGWTFGTPNIATIPRLHRGGTVVAGGPPGAESLVMVQSGERLRVQPLGGSGGGDEQVIIVELDGRTLARAVFPAGQRLIRVRGG